MSQVQLPHLQETELIKNIQELLKRTMAQAVGQIRWVTAATGGPEGWMPPNPCPKAGQRWEAGQLGTDCTSAVRGFGIMARGMQAFLGWAYTTISTFFFPGTWALLAMRDCLSTVLESPEAGWGGACFPVLPKHSGSWASPHH